MVLYLLYMKAEAENVGSVDLRPDSNLRISVRNPLSDCETREDVVFNPHETVDQDESSREPPHHFTLKWEGSKKPSILRALDATEAATALKKNKKHKLGSPRSYVGAEDSGNWVPLLAVECRGLEPYAFKPMKDEFVIVSEGGFRFEEDIDLGEGEWADYDAENDCPVSLQEIQFKFEAV
jgi:Eukaryotic protein of unknown function (DUF866)